MRRKLLFIFAAVALLVCALAITVGAVEVDGVHYSLDTNNKVATVNTENKTATTEIVTIPSTFIYEGAEYKVTKISNDAFSGNKNVKELRILSEYITAIPVAMIANTNGGALEKIYIDFSRITSIGSAAFNPSSQTNGNSPVTNKFYYYDAKAFIENGKDVLITEPDFSNCTSIGVAAFQGANFEKLTIPAAVYLKNQTFRQTSIKELVIEGEDRTIIEYYAFNNCTKLEKVTVKSRNLQKIGNDVFSSCTALKEIYIDLSKCTQIDGSAFILNGSYDGGQTRTQWYNLEGEKIVDLTSMKIFKEKCFASSNLGSAKIIWPRAIEQLDNQTFRKCNINQPMLINVAEGKSITLPYYAFDGNNPTIFVCNEGVTNVQVGFSGVTAVFLAPEINITGDGNFKNASTLYCKGFAEGSKTFGASDCTVITITSGTINNYGACGFVAIADGTEVGTVAHTTTDAIDNALCPVGKVNVTTCKYCTYKAYSVDGESTEAKAHTYTLDGSIVYTDFFQMGFKTTMCECGAELASETATEAPLFESLGYSACTYSKGLSITQGFKVNDSAIEAYKAYAPDFTFGVLATVNNKGEAYAPSLESENVVSKEFAQIVNDYIDIKVTGIPADKADALVVLCAYVKVGGKTLYLDNGVCGETVVGISYNEANN